MNIPRLNTSPWIDHPNGREHHNFVYSSWMAGSGVFHATILRLLGFDHTRLIIATVSVACA
jgi:hypothetical protein